MIWRLGDQVVVAVGKALWLVDATGAIAKYEPSEWSVDEDLSRTTFEVREGQLIERTVIEHWGSDRPDTIREYVVLDGLCEDASLELRRFADVALGDDAVVREEARLREERAADARVAAIEGALDELGVTSAQQALVYRIRHYADDTSAALLRTLIDLARTRPATAALDAYVRACLLATFGAAPPLVNGTPTPSPLAGIVAALAERIHRIGDGQSEADAPRNAEAYWAAAEALQTCARMLG